MNSIVNIYNMLDNKNYLFQCIFILAFLSFNTCDIIKNSLLTICCYLIFATIATIIMYNIIVLIAPTFMIKHLVFLIIILIIYHIIYHIISIIYPEKCKKYYEQIDLLANKFMLKIGKENENIKI